MKTLNSANYQKMRDQPEVGGTPSFSGEGSVDSTNQTKSSLLVGSSYDFIGSAQTQAKLPLVGNTRGQRKKCAKSCCSSKCCHHGKHGQVARQIEKSDSRTNSTLPLSDNDRASKMRSINRGQKCESHFDDDGYSTFINERKSSADEISNTVIAVGNQEQKKSSTIIQRDKIKSVSRNRCCRFFSACDKKKAQSLVNVTFDGLNSVFQNTNLVLMLRRYSLSIFMHSSEPASSNLIIFVGSGMLVVDIFDTIAHFSISNHNRYRKKTDAELSEEPLSPWVVQLGALACAFSCSLNRVALPITIATIAESVSGAKVDDVPYLNIALFALTAVFSVVHIWSARANYDVAYKHLSGDSEEANKPCPCC